MITSHLIANREEIDCRIVHTARRPVYSEYRSH